MNEITEPEQNMTFFQIFLLRFARCNLVLKDGSAWHVLGTPRGSRMSVLATMTGIDSVLLQIRRNSRELDSAVRRLRKGHSEARSDFRKRLLSRRQKVAERRKDLRQPLHVPVYLTPCLVKNGLASCVGETIMGVTRDVSDNGVGFGFDQPVTSSHLIAEFDIYGRGPVKMLVEIRWIEKKSAHAFVAGGLWQGIIVTSDAQDAAKGEPLDQ